MTATRQTPPIEVLLAVYNGERYLAAFLDSLLAQTCDEFRLVVSDNRSTDGTGAILEAYRDRFQNGLTVLPLPPETVPAVRNFARVTQAAQAPYVMFADADDIWHADKVAKTFAAMRRAEAESGQGVPILVHADLAVVDSELRPINPSFWAYQYINPHRVRLSQLLLRNCVTGCTTMLNRALLEASRPVPDDAPMHDYWFALVAAALGRIVVLEEPLIEYRQHGANDTGAKAWGAGFILGRARAIGSAPAGAGPRRSLRSKIAQSRALLARLGGRLSEADRAKVTAFSGLEGKSALMRRWCLVRHGLWDDGLLRNIGLFLAI